MKNLDEQKIFSKGILHWPSIKLTSKRLKVKEAAVWMMVRKNIKYKENIVQEFLKEIIGRNDGEILGIIRKKDNEQKETESESRWMYVDITWLTMQMKFIIWYQTRKEN